MHFAVLRFAFGRKAEARFLFHCSEQASGGVATDLRPMLEAVA
jgi:hypothetical protein